MLTHYNPSKFGQDKKEVEVRSLKKQQQGEEKRRRRGKTLTGYASATTATIQFWMLRRNVSGGEWSSLKKQQQQGEEKRRRRGKTLTTYASATTTTTIRVCMFGERGGSRGGGGDQGD